MEMDMEMEMVMFPMNRAPRCLMQHTNAFPIISIVKMLDLLNVRCAGHSKTALVTHSKNGLNMFDFGKLALMFLRNAREELLQWLLLVPPRGGFRVDMSGSRSPPQTAVTHPLFHSSTLPLSPHTDCLYRPSLLSTDSP